MTALAARVACLGLAGERRPSAASLGDSCLLRGLPELLLLLLPPLLRAVKQALAAPMRSANCRVLEKTAGGWAGGRAMKHARARPVRASRSSRVARLEAKGV